MSNDGRIFIKPKTQADGVTLKVRKPVNGHLRAEGEWVNPESYWLRRIKDGDVVEATAPADSAAVPTADSTKARK
ncbi:MAG: DUF2635 domain-containing protein [Hydrogenophaga sp.]|nr:DUF2635 domain-containing protein [Hydrogenophaga sp.]